MPSFAILSARRLNDDDCCGRDSRPILRYQSVFRYPYDAYSSEASRVMEIVSIMGNIDDGALEPE